MSLLLRREGYALDDLPPHNLVAGVDVQKDRLEASLVAFGAEEEAWLIEHVICAGDTTDPAVWAELDELLADYQVSRVVVDSGYNTSMVYEFCKRSSWRIPGKGQSGVGRPLIEDPLKRRARLRNRRRKGLSPEPIGVDQGKALIHSRLRSVRVGPGYIHLPDHPSVDDEYVAQLGAEKLMTRRRQGRMLQEWVQIRPRNEALDCMVYALAAHRFSSWTPPVEVAPIPPKVRAEMQEHGARSASRRPLIR